MIKFQRLEKSTTVIFKFKLPILETGYKLYQFDPDLDLTDFKFLIGDIVKYE